jgi:hypothetical protein
VGAGNRRLGSQWSLVHKAGICVFSCPRLEGDRDRRHSSNAEGSSLTGLLHQRGAESPRSPGKTTAYRSGKDVSK